MAVVSLYRKMHIVILQKLLKEHNLVSRLPTSSLTVHLWDVHEKLDP